MNPPPFRCNKYYFLSNVFARWKERRCLIPANGYYEWLIITEPGQTKPRKQPFYIARQDGLPCTFAGLWERLEG